MFAANTARHNALPFSSGAQRRRPEGTIPELFQGHGKRSEMLECGVVHYAANNFAFEVHNYFNNDASSSDTCISADVGVVRLFVVTNCQCWGRNSYGELGNGETVDSLVPVMVTGITNAVAVATGEGHSCALLRSGQVQCWGWNNVAQLGDGTMSDSRVPVVVGGVTNATTIASGAEHNCAVLRNGQVQCWGDNSSLQRGDGTYTSSYVNFLPGLVSGITSAISIGASGGLHTCALLSSGSVKCWGWNGDGELGDGTTTTGTVPVTVQGF